MKILFISHSYPPILGGVESQNFNLAQGLGKIADVKIIANSKGKIWLPVFLPYAFIRALFLMGTYDVCLLGNGVLAPIGTAIRIFYPNYWHETLPKVFPKKIFCSVVHGLDITFAQKKGFLPFLYRNINIPSLKALHKLFMVGNFTIDEAVKAGIKKDKCVFIPNGTNVSDFKKSHSREELSQLFRSDAKNKKVILRLGRFVPHKGTDWFIRNVMPKLPENVVMIATGYRVNKNTAGDPDNFEDCKKAIHENNLEERVKLLPSLPQKDLLILLNTADLVISPNIEIPGSSEGFGINAIEAAACERVVVASDLQGLKDAIRDKENGFLLEPENAQAWTEKIKELLENDSFRAEFGKKAREYVEENLTWEKISRRYLEEIEKVIKK